MFGFFKKKPPTAMDNPQPCPTPCYALGKASGEIMVRVFAVKRYDIKNDRYERLPGKYTAERFDRMVALSNGVKPAKVFGSEEEVDQSELDSEGRYDPYKKDRH